MQSNSQANASDNSYNVASNRISANIGDASKTGESSDGANEVQVSLFLSLSKNTKYLPKKFVSII
jgi:hypothetical protein